MKWGGLPGCNERDVDMMELKLNGNIQRYVWSVIVEKASDNEDEWSKLILGVRRRTLNITKDNVEGFKSAFAWFAEMADDELDEKGFDMTTEEREGNKKELACASKILDKLWSFGK